MPHPTPGVETYRGTVYPWHCDHVGHMNVMWYVGKFDEATWHLFRMAGLSPGYLRGSGRGMAALDQHIEYRRELKAGDVVTVQTRMLEVGERKLRFQHEMHNEDSGEIAAVTTLLAIHMDTQARKSCNFEPAVAQKARSLLTA